jgi:hypothetical protein
LYRDENLNQLLFILIGFPGMALFWLLAVTLAYPTGQSGILSENQAIQTVSPTRMTRAGTDRDKTGMLVDAPHFRIKVWLSMRLSTINAPELKCKPG